jgi:glycosyltransferase involved in cell wall biosynthesis
MKIAIMGIRGIPAKYGGFETFAEQLAPRLVKKGHHVVVYGRSNIIDYKEKYYKGVKLIILPTISHKYLDTPIHTLFSVIHSLFHQYDVILICNAANSIFSFIPRLTGKRVVVNVDGIERRRKKWNWFGKLWYLMGEMFSCIFPNQIVTDAQMIEKYYLRRYNKRSTMISYGYDPERVSTVEILAKFGLSPKEYVLFVGRFEPENNVHLVITAFEKVKTEKKLVIIGNAPYSSNYREYLFDLAKGDKRIIFTGYTFGASYREFQSNAYCYIHAGEVGGSPPALIEAMGFANCVIVNGTPENIEVVGNSGLIYKENDSEDLKEKLQYVIDNPNLIKSYGEKARERVEQNYSWDVVTDKYEKLFLQMLNGCWKNVQ